MPSTTRRNWSRDETLVAFRLYCRTPFGRLHRSNPEIIVLAAALGRTPSAVGMKACNFASLDPKQRERGIKALPNVSGLDERVWAEFEANPEAVAAEAEEAYDRLTGAPDAGGTAREEPIVEPPPGPTEDHRLVRVRRVQGFFRAAVLASYEHRCALTGLDVPELLNASHIIPWSASVERRADPSNGLCLHALLDRAFDRGLLTFDAALRAVVSNRLAGNELACAALAPGGVQGRRLNLPTRFAPDPRALAYHREHVFERA